MTKIKPNDYRRYFDGKPGSPGNRPEALTAELWFLRLLPEVARQMKPKTRGIDICAAEFGTNFLASGADKTLTFGIAPFNGDDRAFTPAYTGWTEYGCDRFTHEWVREMWGRHGPRLHSLVPASIAEIMDRAANAGWEYKEQQITASGVPDPPNPREEPLQVLHLQFHHGLWINAAMFAERAMEAADRIGPGPFVRLPRRGRFFWATMYFVAGAPAAREQLKRHGVQFFQQEWDGHNGYQEQSLKRTLSMCSLLRDVYRNCPNPDQP